MSETEGTRVLKALKKISSNIEKLYEARELVEAQKYDKALTSYLAAISGSVGNVPDLELCSSLTKLVRNYPDARGPLTARRNQLEIEIEDGAISRCLSEEWMELNKALGENYRELELIERMRKSTHRNDKFVIFQTIKCNFEKYLQDKRYDILEPYLDRFGQTFLMQYVDFESAVLFPDALERRSAFEDENLVEKIIADGITLMEACLGLERFFAAREVLQKLLKASTSANTFTKLAKAARRAEKQQFLNEILKRAQKELSKYQYSELKKFATEA